MQRREKLEQQFIKTRAQLEVYASTILEKFNPATEAEDVLLSALFAESEGLPGDLWETALSFLQPLELETLPRTNCVYFIRAFESNDNYGECIAVRIGWAQNLSSRLREHLNCPTRRDVVGILKGVDNRLEAWCHGLFESSRLHPKKPSWYVISKELVLFLYWLRGVGRDIS